MSAQDKTKNLWPLDTRVRERNLKSGLLTEKDLEKHLAGLPDLEGQTEAFGTHQPALEAPDEPEMDDDDLDDEEDDLDDESDDEPEAAHEAPAAEAPAAEPEPSASGGNEEPA